ncbi:MAG: phosphodiesterase [Erysipelotrichaceae bacterium]|nr:phosphodiesterase [Erysipelotrichaceae bacterium]
MKNYVICSDVHGSITTLRKVVDFFLINKFDKLIILGDLLYHGPRNNIPRGYNPKEVIKLLNPLKDKIVMVKGNCEAEVDQMVLDFKIHNKKKIMYNLKTIYLEHGHHLDKENSNYQKGDIVFYGHTHVSKCERINGITFINPGSITLPKENTKKSFIALVNGRILLLDLNSKIIDEYYVNER